MTALECPPGRGEMTSEEFRRLTRFGRAVTGRIVGWGRADDPDFLSVTGEACWRAAAEWDESRGVKFSTHLATKVQFAVIDEVRRQLGHGGGKRPIRMAGPLGDWDAPTGTEEMERVLDRAVLETVLRAVELRPREADAIRLLCAGWRQAEIAREWGVDQAHVSRVVKRATRKLRAAIEGEGKGERA